MRSSLRLAFGIGLVSAIGLALPAAASVIHFHDDFTSAPLDPNFVAVTSGGTITYGTGGATLNYSGSNYSVLTQIVGQFSAYGDFTVTEHLTRGGAANVEPELIVGFLNGTGTNSSSYFALAYGQGTAVYSVYSDSEPGPYPSISDTGLGAVIGGSVTHTGGTFKLTRVGALYTASYEADGATSFTTISQLNLGYTGPVRMWTSYAGTGTGSIQATAFDATYNDLPEPASALLVGAGALAAARGRKTA